MTYSPDSVGMHRHTFTGRPAFTGQPASKTPPRFHVLLRTPRRRVRTNGKRRFRRKLPDGIPHARQIHERPQTAARTIYRRMARTLRTMASGKRTGDKQRRVPHALPAGRLQQGRGQGQLHRIPRQSVLPQAYQAGGDPQARAAARNAQADQRRRPVRTASEICAGARPLHVQLLHPRHGRSWT